MIDRDFADLGTAYGVDTLGRIARSVGTNFGSRELQGVATWPTDKPIPEAMWATAVRIFAFDALTQNPDRRFNPNPNLFSRGNEIFVFDHELAFSFLDDILPQKEPWLVSQTTYLTDHVFFRRLKARELDLDRFVSLLAALPETELSRILADVPQEWNNGNVSRIESHLALGCRPFGAFWRRDPKETRVRIPYSFSVLRYTYDAVTQEFVNIGVAVYSQQTGFFRAMCTVHYSRISQVFAKIDGNRFRQLTRYIQEQVNGIGEGLSTELPFEPARTIEQLLSRVLPRDDSAFQFSSPAGVGLTHDLEKTLAELFDRYVERYATRAGAARRDDEDVWRVFKEPLEKRHVTAHLERKRIVAPNYDYEFEHSWKNGVWNVYEPVSLDLVDGSSILEKANRWVGRATSLNASSDRFKIHSLIGEPEDERLRSTFVKAENILNTMPGRKEFVREGEAEAFAEELEREVQRHAG